MSRSIKTLVSLAIITALLFALSIPAFAAKTDYDGTYKAEDGSVLTIKYYLKSFASGPADAYNFNLNGMEYPVVYLEGWRDVSVPCRSSDGEITFAKEQFLFGYKDPANGIYMEAVGYDSTAKTYLLINSDKSDTSFYLVKDDATKDKNDNAAIWFTVLKTYKLTARASATATPTASKVTVDGTSVSFDAYNIDGNNYFKLRDLAKVLNGTKKQFEVSWDGSKNAIILTSGKAYTSLGSELVTGNAKNATATATNSSIYINGAQVNLTAYNINGNNYFKLRDIGKAFNFGVTWVGATNTIKVDTSTGYSEN